MSRYTKPLIAALLPALILSAAPAATPPEALSLNQLETRRNAIDTELDQLARLTLRSGVGNIGWISNSQKDPTAPIWVHITLSDPEPFDRIVLAPVLWNDAVKGPQADGLPEAFEILAGREGDPEGRVIASRCSADRFLPRIAPLEIRVPPTSADWVRIQSTRLAPHARNGNYRFKLAEIMVFSGQRNIALNQPVLASSTVGGWGDAAIYPAAMVDGLTPYLMDAAIGTKSDPYMAFSKHGEPFAFVVDLAESLPIDAIRLHGADVNEYIPQINPSDFGMPKRLIFEAANQADFSDAEPLLDYRLDSVYQAGNILEWRIPETRCRYVRLSVPADAWPLDAGKNQFCISFAELEILSDGQNVAEGQTVRFPPQATFKNSRAASLTDGRNHFGAILPLAEWLNQLARRHDLETERPVVTAELNRRYARQKENVRQLSWIAVLLTSGIGFIILFERMHRQRSLHKTRERIAANLHDELGANLNALALLGDFAQSLMDQQGKQEQWAQLTKVIREVRNLSKETGETARHCTNLLEITGQYESLIEEIRRAANRLLADMKHEITFTHEEMLKKLHPERRIDLALFYKECLNNIVRHAGATHVTTQVAGSPKGIALSIQDDGRGLSGSAKPDVPASLKRRARLLGGKITVETPAEGGTLITLKIRFRRGPHRLAPKPKDSHDR
jgi:signal transduction histidine kinase